VFEIGRSLRDARVRQGLELTQLEAETKIRAKYLRAIEEERFDQLPGDTYAKGFLRSYAERLGLDGQLYVDEYNSRFSLMEEPVFATRPGRRSRRSRLESHAVLIALAGIVAVTVLVIAAWQLGGSDSGGPATETTDAPATSVGSGAPDASTLEESAAAAPAVELLVTARRGPSVAEIRRGSATGELLYEGTLTEGQSKSFAAAKKLWLRLSKPQNVQLVLNGEMQDAGAEGPSILVATAGGLRVLAT
jgi:cytoskeletal protein RodZ